MLNKKIVNIKMGVGIVRLGRSSLQQCIGAGRFGFRDSNSGLFGETQHMESITMVEVSYAK